MVPVTLSPSARFLLSHRFEKVIDITHSERSKCALIRAAAGDPPASIITGFFATGRHIRDTANNRIVATVFETADSPETLAAHLTDRATLRQAEPA